MNVKSTLYGKGRILCFWYLYRQDVTFMNRSFITYCMEIPVTQDTSCALETRLDIHEQVSYYYILYRDTSNTRKGRILCYWYLYITYNN
jgi:hypothetical protein